MFKSIQTKYNELSKVSSSIFYAGMVSSILCVLGGVIYMAYLVVGKIADPYLWFLTMSFVQKTTGLFMLAVVIPLFIDFVKTPKE